MAEIVARTSGGIEELRLALGTEQIISKLDIGTTWNSLRIVVNPQFQGTSNITSSPVFFVGLCSGNLGYKDSSPKHVVGVKTTGATWTYNGSYLMFRNTESNNEHKPTKIVGAVETEGATEEAPISYAQGTRRLPIYYEITKNGSNFDFEMKAPYFSAGFSNDIDDYNWINETEMAAGEFGDDVAYDTIYDLGSLAVDESTDGNLDSLNIYWSKSTPKCEIADYIVYRMS
jgi:hypothetical protein